MQATDILSEEHRQIMKVVAAMQRHAAAVEQGSVPDGEFIARAATFFRVFADSCHHAKEEGILFPALADAGIPEEGGPIGVMKYEHEIGRAAVRRLAGIGDDLKAGNAVPGTAVAGAMVELGDFYQQHIWKEDNVLFPMAGQVLGEAADAEIVRKYDETEETHGHGVHCEQSQFADSADGLFR